MHGAKKQLMEIFGSAIFRQRPRNMWVENALYTVLIVFPALYGVVYIFHLYHVHCMRLLFITIVWSKNIAGQLYTNYITLLFQSHKPT